MLDYGKHIELHLDEASPNTLIEYEYRDQGNYRQSGTVVLAGRISPEQIRAMKSSFQDGEFFIPNQVGIAPLQGGFEHGGGWDEDDDHVFHTIEAIRHVKDAPTGPSVADVMAAWPKSDEEWNVARYVEEMSSALARPRM